LSVIRTGDKVAIKWLLEVLRMSHGQTSASEGYVSRDYLVYLRDFALSKGIGSKDLLAGTDKDLSFLLNPPPQISESSFQIIGTNLFYAVQHPYETAIEFGEGMRLSLHGPLGVAIQGAKNLAEVARLAEEYSPIRANTRTLELFEENGYLCLRLPELSVDTDEFYNLFSLISFKQIVIDLLLPHELDKKCIVQQSSAEPGDFPWHLIQGYEIRFNQPSNQLLIPLEWIKLPIRSIDSELASLAVEQCERKLSELSPGNLIAKIELMLAQQVSKHLSLKNMADLCFVSPSTLQRRLKETNTTFKAIKARLRLNEAKQLLLEKRVSIEQISDQLGYCDASSFTKSFKTSVGETPAIYRKQQSVNE